MELRQTLYLVRRWAWLLVLGLILGGVGAYVASRFQEPIYSTTTKIMVMRAPEDTGSEFSALSDYQLTRSFSQLIVTEPVLTLVSERLGFIVQADQISVRQASDSQIIDLSLEHTDPAAAALIANTLVEVFVEYNNSLQLNRFASSEESIKAQIDQVENQISGLQAEMNQISQEGIQSQRQQIESQIAELEHQISGVRNEVSRLSGDEDKIAEFDEEFALLNQLQARLNLYQQVYFNLTVLGESVGAGGHSLHLNQLQTTLALYQQIYSSLLNNYENVRLARLRGTPNIVQIESARIHSDPVRPQPLRNAALGAAVGVIIMGAIVFLIEYLDDTLRAPEDVTRQLDLPILGLITSYENKAQNLVTILEPRSSVAEAFRTLRTNIQFASLDKKLHTLLITSPSSEEGKSTIAVNLAVALAQDGRRVALLDTDLRRPKIHKLLNLPHRGGVSGVIPHIELFLDGKLNLNGALQGTHIKGLKVLTSGTLPLNPSELLASEKMSQAIRMIGRNADVIVLDSPPVLAVTDASVLASLVDGVLLVLKPGVTKLASTRDAVEQLQRVGANILGVVLNDFDLKGSSYDQYHYKGYYYMYKGNYGGKSTAVGTSHKRVKIRRKREAPLS